MYPLRPADVRTITATEAAAGIAITNALTHLKLSLTSDSNLVLTPSAELYDGAQVILDHASDTTARTVTPTTGFLSGTPTATGVISKRRSTVYFFDKAVGSFKLLAATITIN